MIRSELMSSLGVERTRSRGVSLFYVGFLLVGIVLLLGLSITSLYEGNLLAAATTFGVLLVTLGVGELLTRWASGRSSS